MAALEVPLKEDTGYSEGIVDIFNDSSTLRSLFLTTDKLCVEYSVLTNLLHASLSEWIISLFGHMDFLFCTPIPSLVMDTAAGGMDAKGTKKMSNF